MQARLQYIGQTRPYDGDIYNLSTQGTLKIRTLSKDELAKFEDGLLKDAIRQAQSQIASSVAKDMVAYAREVYKTELTGLVKEYVKKNKKEIMGTLLEEAKKKAIDNIRSAMTYYD